MTWSARAVRVGAALVLCLVGLAGAQSSPARAATTTLTFPPAADAFIASSAPTTNYGASTGLQVDNQPVKHILLKFAVAGIGTRQVTSAHLRLYAYDPSPLGGIFYSTASTSWSESTVTWNTAPATVGGPAATLGAVGAGPFYEVDLTSLVTGDGTYGLRVTSTASDGADYTSKEGTTAQRPHLVVITR